jgi:hypothetical protein
MKTKIEDPIVLAVMNKFYERSQTGITKYGTTLDRDDLSHIEWLNHAQDELMDATLYLERLKREIKGKLLRDMMREDEKDGLYNTESLSAVDWLIDKIETNRLFTEAGEYWNILKREAIRLDRERIADAYNSGKNAPF